MTSKASKKSSDKSNDKLSAKLSSEATSHRPVKLNQKALALHKKRFLRFFPDAFNDQRYIDWERTYKWQAHKLFMEHLSKDKFKALMHERSFDEIGARALAVEGKTNFIFSFEKMALRDGIKAPGGARIFAEGLYSVLYGGGPVQERFIAWLVALSDMPRKKSRILSWPVATFFPFIAQPAKHIILKPTAMKAAAAELQFDLDYSSKPGFNTYNNLLTFAALTKEAIADLEPKDFHDVQSFLWTIGSAEYERLEEEMKLEGLWK